MHHVSDYYPSENESDSDSDVPVSDLIAGEKSKDSNVAKLIETYESLTELQTVIDNYLANIEQHRYAQLLLQDLQLLSSAITTAITFIDTTLLSDLRAISSTTVTASSYMVTNIFATWDNLKDSAKVMSETSPNRGRIAEPEVEFEDVVEPPNKRKRGEHR